MRRLVALALLTAGLLTACTGTEEPQNAVRLATLTDGIGSGAPGQQVTGARTLQVAAVGGTPTQTTVTNAVDAETLPGGGGLLLAFPDRLEARTPAGEVSATLPAPGFRACFVRLRASVARDRFAALSDCADGSPQQLAVYRSDLTLAWTVTLPPPTPALSESTRYVVSADPVTSDGAVWLTRPAVGGGSEVLRATSSGLTVLSTQASPVYDLGLRGGAVYAATDAGVQALNTAGVPTGAVVISGRQDRLYGSEGLLAAWRLSGNAEPLSLWDGARVGQIPAISQLRDATLAPDGNIYLLTPGALTGYDTVFGLQRNEWRPVTVSGNLNEARATTWLRPQ